MLLAFCHSFHFVVKKLCNWRRFKWRVDSADGEVSGSGEGLVRMGGVYVLCVRERLGRLDAAVLHAPNPPNELHLAWIVPQYLLISVAEIMFAVSGLEFAFTQVNFYKCLFILA